MQRVKVKQEVIQEEQSDEFALRETIKEVKEVIESKFVVLAKSLYEVFTKKVFIKWGFPTYVAYVENELKFSYRKAKELTDIWVRIEELGIPHDRIDALGWSKASELVKVMTPDTVDLWLTKGETMPLSEIESVVKTEVDKRFPDNRPKLTTMVFKLDEADTPMVTDALNLAMRLFDTDSKVLALAQICTEWSQSKGTTPAGATLDDYLKFINKTFGVELGIVKPIKGGKPLVETLAPHITETADFTSIELDDETINSLLED